MLLFVEVFLSPCSHVQVRTRPGFKNQSLIVFLVRIGNRMMWRNPTHAGGDHLKLSTHPGKEANLQPSFVARLGYPLLHCAASLLINIILKFSSLDAVLLRLVNFCLSLFLTDSL